MFENRDPRAARSNMMHEWTSQLKIMESRSTPQTILYKI